MNVEIKDLKKIAVAERSGTVSVLGELQEELSKQRRLAIEALKRADIAEGNQAESEAANAKAKAEYESMMASMKAELASKEKERAAAVVSDNKACEDLEVFRKVIPFTTQRVRLPIRVCLSLGV